MRLAYLIMLHDRPEQALRLLERVRSPGNLCAVHVDRRASRATRSLVGSAVEPLPDVAMLRSGYCTYSGWGMVETQLRGMRELLRQGSWDFFINLSAQDYPLRSQAELSEALRPCVGSSLVDFADQEATWPESLARLRRFNLEAFGRAAIVPLVPKKLPAGWRFQIGSQWMILARQACVALAAPDERTRELVRLYRRSRVPDEGFVHTALANSPLCGTLRQGSRRFVEFSGARPRVLDAADAERLLEDRRYLFARKFSDPAVLDLIDEQILRAA